MDFFSGVVNFLVVMVFLRIIFTIASAMRSMFRSKEETKAPASPNSPLFKALEESQVRELVADENCGAMVPKDQAYIIMGDDRPHYFCSWECRQEYIAKGKSQKED